MSYPDFLKLTFDCDGGARRASPLTQKRDGACPVKTPARRLDRAGSTRKDFLCLLDVTKSYISSLFYIDTLSLQSV